jgi:endonuclease-3
MARPRVPTEKILGILEELYPDAHCALDHRNAFELLIATILSAQCTDKTVNKVTPALFAAYPDPASLAAADAGHVERLINECGLFKTKAKNIVRASRRIVEEHGGAVPGDMEALIQLPGVGRKTANVVLSNAFGVPAIAVDTHVQRVSNRIGLADSGDVLDTERQLMRRIPRERWSQAHHLLIYHGRQVCDARRPKCEICPLAPHCRHYSATISPSSSTRRRMGLRQN